MKILNFGSLNLDYVYQVDHMTRAGETQPASSRTIFPGGKGLNQSIALARAGAPVYHAGLVGSDGDLLVSVLERDGVDVQFVSRGSGPSGHAVIQVDQNGQNCILLYSGTNSQLTPAFVDQVLSQFGSDDWLLLQNEINQLPYIIDAALERGMKIILNPSPINDALYDCDLNKVSLFLLNEIEGATLSGIDRTEDILNYMIRHFPNAATVLTLGNQGAWYGDPTQQIFQPSCRVLAVDTTAAGDTFTGYFVAARMRSFSCQSALSWGARAAAISVTRHGAAPSIPHWAEVESWLG